MQHTPQLVHSTVMIISLSNGEKVLKNNLQICYGRLAIPESHDVPFSGVCCIN